MGSIPRIHGVDDTLAPSPFPFLSLSLSLSPSLSLSLSLSLPLFFFLPLFLSLYLFLYVSLSLAALHITCPVLCRLSGSSPLHGVGGGVGLCVRPRGEFKMSIFCQMSILCQQWTLLATIP